MILENHTRLPTSDTHRTSRAFLSRVLGPSCVIGKTVPINGARIETRKSFGEFYGARRARTLFYGFLSRPIPSKCRRISNRIVINRPLLSVRRRWNLFVSTNRHAAVPFFLLPSKPRRIPSTKLSNCEASRGLPKPVIFGIVPRGFIEIVRPSPNETPLNSLNDPLSRAISPYEVHWFQRLRFTEIGKKGKGKGTRLSESTA